MQSIKGRMYGRNSNSDRRPFSHTHTHTDDKRFLLKGSMKATDKAAGQEGMFHIKRFPVWIRGRLRHYYLTPERKK